MIKNKYKSLRINNIFHDEHSLQRVAKQILNKKSTKDWEIDIYTFILDWISDSDSIIVQSSGSTGKPKRIELPKRIMIQSSIYTAEALSFKENENALLCLPAKYIAGKMMIVRAFVNNLNLMIAEPSSNPLKDIYASIDFAAMVPLQVATIIKQNTNQHQLKSIRNLIIGGGMIDPDIQDSLANYPNNVYATYGMTETATHIALKKLNSNNRQKYYKCLYGISVRKDEGQCLLIQAPHISREEIITNDIANVYSSTQFDIIGRKDNIINTGGIKIIPEVLERKIRKITTDKLFISSLPDKVLGEKIILVVESQKKDLHQLYTLWKTMEEVLEKNEIPKHIEFLKSFVYTDNGKINRKETIKQINHF